MAKFKHELITSAPPDHDKQSVLLGRKVFRWSFIIAALLALIVAIGLVVSLCYSNIEAIDQFMLDSKPWLGYWRLLLFLLVFGGWNTGSRLYAHWSLMRTEQLQQMMRIRWRMALWVLVMEAVLAQHVLSDFVDGLLQAGGTS